MKGPPGQPGGSFVRTTPVSAFAACEDVVRRHDPDRYFSALFAPADKRHFLFAVYAFHDEVARVADAVREPMIGDIRLAWWRETAEGARAGKPRNHDVARALAETLAVNDLPRELFERIIEARGFDIGPALFGDMGALEDYCDSTSGNIMRLAARVLGAGDTLDELACEAGIAFALAGLLRAVPFHAVRKKLYLPEEMLREAGLSPEDVFAGRFGEKIEKIKIRIAQRARHHLATARKCARPQDVLPAFLPAALVPLYLRRSDPALWRKQIVLLGAAMRGHI